MCEKNRPTIIIVYITIVLMQQILPVGLTGSMQMNGQYLQCASFHCVGESDFIAASQADTGVRI